MKEVGHGEPVIIKINPNASIDMTTYTLQYQYTTGNPVVESEWKFYSSADGIDVSENGTIHVRLYDKNSHEAGKEYAKEIMLIDKTGPTISNLSTSDITTKSVKLNVTASDTQSGLAQSGTYQYYLNNELKYTTTDSSYTYEGLTSATPYTLKVVVTDNIGNTAEKTATAETLVVPGGTNNVGMIYTDKIGISFDTANWTDGNVVVTLTNKTGKSSYKLQYQIDGVGDWKDYDETAKPELTAYQSFIVARLTDNTTSGQTGNIGEIATGNVMKIDKTKPTISEETPLKVTDLTTNSISLKIKVKDELSGLSKIKWCYKKSTDSEYKTEEDEYQTMKGSIAGATTEQEKTKILKGLTSGTTYSIYAEVYDVAGNMTQSSMIEGHAHKYTEGVCEICGHDISYLSANQGFSDWSASFLNNSDSRFWLDGGAHFDLSHEGNVGCLVYNVPVRVDDLLGIGCRFGGASNTAASVHRSTIGIFPDNSGARQGMLEDDRAVFVSKSGHYGEGLTDVSLDLDVQNCTGVYYVKIIMDRISSATSANSFWTRNIRVFPIYKEMK